MATSLQHPVELVQVAGTDVLPVNFRESVHTPSVHFSDPERKDPFRIDGWPSPSGRACLGKRWEDVTIGNGKY